ncbi:class II aldolase/adducin family protein [Pelagicoccus sp. SDUM812003]|uniref:class II aldolase/adducin family protein n=1 Tax=Pelagicoccus sp. SDUM812003 TaxID=3041267 RepID=UPI00280DC23D|nr:class II aldolase/adducin family protein [Pelagicoccus sp. SDUM812003]MDQ8204640.1 class II aldolase/adducin family protein [Pelagicoccus sp. SDUM812003]
MKKLITAKEAEALLKSGQALPSGALLTPSARDVIAGFNRGGSKSVVSAQSSVADDAAPIVPDYEYKWTPGSDPKTPAEIKAFFYSPEIEAIKVRMCEMGDRMWKREYTDGNGGNLTVRVGDNLCLCTPTLISKGFMKPEHMCLVDLDGKQLAGKYKRTSEAMTHLAIMKRVPEAKACCHAHPPHATAYAVAKVQPPTCLIPEAEVFLGQIGMAEYQTPGTPENATVVGEAAKKGHMSVLMLNHGVITWGKDIEDAYWKMENTESYCKTIWVASQLGNELTPISGKQAKELIALRKSLGMSDPRADWQECELCQNDGFRPGMACRSTTEETPTAPQGGGVDDDAERLIHRITNEILKQIGA